MKIKKRTTGILLIILSLISNAFWIHYLVHQYINWHYRYGWFTVPYPGLLAKFIVAINLVSLVVGIFVSANKISKKTGYGFIITLILINTVTFLIFGFK
jgi:hypothetical protein